MVVEPERLEALVLPPVRPETYVRLCAHWGSARRRALAQCNVIDVCANRVRFLDPVEVGLVDRPVEGPRLGPIAEAPVREYALHLGRCQLAIAGDFSADSERDRTIRNAAGRRRRRR